MKQNEHITAQTYSFMALRKCVGWIGILLPVTLMTGVFLIFRGNAILNSISQYYHSGMRDVFVGAICAIGLFLLYYKGYNRMDNITASLAGFFAICVAWFPTIESGPYNFVAIIHFISATFFFLILAGISLFLFTRKGSDPSPEKLSRNKIYRICGITMIVCLLSIMIYYIIKKENYSDSSFVFWAETIALIAFGVSWLTKGGALYPDKQDRESRK